MNGSGQSLKKSIPIYLSITLSDLIITIALNMLKGNDFVNATIRLILDEAQEANQYLNAMSWISFEVKSFERMLRRNHGLP